MHKTHFLLSFIRVLEVHSDIFIILSSYFKLLFALKWRDRLWKLCSYELNEFMTSADFQTTLFAVHWKWIVDYLNPVLAELLSHDR